MTRIAIVPVLILLGGVIAWLDGRRLVREADRPNFPERWWGYLARVRVLGALLVATMVFGVSVHLWSLGFALMAPALLVACYPARRAAYGETWGVLRYGATAVRRAAALVGFWALVAVTPQVILVAPEGRWVAAAALALLLLGSVWYRRQIFLVLVGARRFVGAPQGFAGVLARAHLDAPVEVYRAGTIGGLSANAFALPCADAHAVVIGDTLIDALDGDALTAIFAHEVAHLEHWTGRRVRRLTVIATVLAVLAVAGALGALQLPAEIALPLTALWGTGVVLGVAVWMTAQYGEDAGGDVRAAALCGDPESLARALVTVHTLRRIPRRLSPYYEETSTHPSLARRLQAVRCASGISPADLTSPVVLTSVEPGRAVILDADRAQWLEGVDADAPREPESVRSSAHSARSLAYRQLTQLRLVTSVRGVTSLHATDRSGRCWRTRIRPEDVSAAQAALDIVDERLATEPAVTRRRAAVLAVFAAIAGASAWYYVGGVSPVIVLAAFVIARPRQAPTWLVAVLIVSWVAQDALAPKTGVPSFAGTLTAAITGIGAMAFVIVPAVRRRATLLPTARHAIFVGGALGAFALAVGADVLWVARAAAASIPYWRIDSIALSLIAAGMVVALGRWPRRWIAAGASAALGGAVFWFGALAVAAWAPLASGTPLAMRDAPAPASQVVTLDPSAGRLMLSPTAAQFAVRVGRSRVNTPYEVVVGRFGGEQRRLRGYDFSFVDDTLAVLVGPATSGLSVMTTLLDSSVVMEAPGWSISLPAVYEPRVSIDRSSGIWAIAGWHPEEGDAMTATGRIGDDAWQIRRWVIPGEDENASFYYLAVVDAAFSVTRARLVHVPALLSRLAGVDEHRWQLWKLDGKSGVTVATTAAPLVCLDPLPSDETLLCLAQQAAHTVIWSVGGRTGRVTEVGRIGRVRLARLRPGHARLLMADGSVLHVPRDGRPTTRFHPAADVANTVALDSTDGHFATLTRGPEARLSLYDAH